MDPDGLAALITTTVRSMVAGASTVTGYRQPLVAFASADDPRFLQLREVVHPSHMLPHDLVPDAHSVVSFFLPFAPGLSRPTPRTESRLPASGPWPMSKPTN